MVALFQKKEGKQAVNSRLHDPMHFDLSDMRKLGGAPWHVGQFLPA
jgi:hypothetical protein